VYCTVYFNLGLDLWGLIFRACFAGLDFQAFLTMRLIAMEYVPYPVSLYLPACIPTQMVLFEYPSVCPQPNTGHDLICDKATTFPLGQVTSFSLDYRFCVQTGRSRGRRTSTW